MKNDGSDDSAQYINVLRVIEDEPQIVAVVRGYLTKAGFEVISAMDGRTGLFMALHLREA